MKTLFLLGWFVALVLLPSFAQAEVVVEEVEADGGTVTVFHMTVTPAPEPVPALKHRLWSRPQDLQPGNSVVYYLRAFPEGGMEQSWKRLHEQYGDAVDEWYRNDHPISKLPLDKVRIAAGYFEERIKQMIRPGTLCRDTDWGDDALNVRGLETITYLLPHIQVMRAIGRALCLRTRFAIAEHRYEDAIDGLRMNYRLGHDVGQDLFLVSALVGIAIEGLANNNVIDLIAASDSPNLYWALAEVPEPLVDGRRAMQLDITIAPRIVPALLDAETAQHSPAQWAQLVTDGLREFSYVDSYYGSSFVPLIESSMTGLAATGIGLFAYPDAKRRLIAAGKTLAEVEKMPVGQVLFVDAAREYRRISDEHEKWWYVPYREAGDYYQRAVATLETGNTINLGARMAQVLLPAMRSYRNAQMRSQWQRNAFLTLEALRMHAAVAGKFPETLDEITVVPVPDNPITEEPYVYRLDGEMAVLELPFSDGMPGVSWRFEMKLAEKE